MTQNNVEIDIRVYEETSLGVMPVSPTIQEIEKVSFSVNAKADTYVSARMRSDRQVGDTSRGSERTEGDITDELSIKDHDLFLSIAMYGNWVAGASTTGTFSADEDTKAISRSTGSFAALRSGDCVLISGFVNAANNGRKTVVSVSALEIIVAEELVDETGATATIAVEGYKLKNGKVKKSIGIEKYSPDISGNQYTRDRGVKIDTCKIGLNTTGIATVQYTLKGLQRTSHATPISGSVSPSPSGNTLHASSGICLVDGVESGVITNIDITISNAITANNVVGKKFAKDMTEGRSSITVSFSALVEDSTLMNKYLAGEDISILLKLEDDSGNDFLAFNIPKITLTSCDESISGEGALTVACQGNAGFSVAHDTVSMIIQKSNS